MTPDGDFLLGSAHATCDNELRRPERREKNFLKVPPEFFIETQDSDSREAPLSAGVAGSLERQLV